MRIPSAVALIASVGVCTGARGAAADSTKQTPREPGWYGFPIAAIDVLGAAFMATGYELTVSADPCECEEFGSGYLMVLGIFAYAYGGPTLHHDHRRYGAMLGSVALRVGLPLAAGLYAHDRDPEDGWTAVAVLAGAGLASVIDVTLLSRDRRPRSTTRVATPLVAPTAGGAVAGVSVRF